MLAPWLIYLVAAAVALAGFLAAFRSFDAIDDMIEDIRNPADACKSLNSMVPYRLAFQLALTLIFIWQPLAYFCNLAMLFCDLWQMARRGGRLTGWTLYDPKRIQKNDRADWIWYVQMSKCIFYALSVLIYSVMTVLELFYFSSQRK